MINNCVSQGNTGLGIDINGTYPWGGTWDPSYNAGVVTYSNGNLFAGIPNIKDAHSAISYNSGRHYIEFSYGKPGTFGPMIGITPTDGTGSYADPAAQCIWLQNAGNIGLQVGADYYAWGTPLVPGDTLGMLVDLIDHTLTFYKNRNLMGVSPYPVVAGRNYMIVGASPGGNSSVNIAMISDAIVPGG